MVKRRAISFTISHCHRNAAYEGDPESLQRFDELANKIGSNRSRIISLFIETCAKANKLLLPQFAGGNKHEEEVPEVIDKSKDNLTFVQYSGTISTNDAD